MTAIGEYYRVLDVKKDASSEEVKKAFRNGFQCNGLLGSIGCAAVRGVRVPRALSLTHSLSLDAHTAFPRKFKQVRGGRPDAR